MLRARINREKEIQKYPSTYDERQGKRFVYTGTLDLDLHEPPDKWGNTLIAQTVNNFPITADPVISAQILWWNRRFRQHR